MSSTLIIGIGTTGLNVLEQCEQFLFEYTGKPYMDNVAMLYLETDLAKKPRKTAYGKTRIKQIELALEHHQADIYKLKNDPQIDSDWIPEASSLLKNNGAGGMPCYGRLSLWGQANFIRAQEAFQDSYRKIGGDQTTQIIVTGSLTGGTGSGLCVDIAYLLQNITGHHKLKGLFLLPGRTVSQSNPAMMQNCFGALCSIDYFSKNSYEVNFPGLQIKSEYPPYQKIRYISTDFNDASASISLGELIKIAGVTIGLNILDTNVTSAGLTNIINAREVDSDNANYTERNISYGFKVLQFPKTQLEELASIHVCEKLLKNIINAEKVSLNNDQKLIESYVLDLEQKIKKELEGILNKAFDELNASTYSNAKQNIDNLTINQALDVIVSEYGRSEEKIKYLIELFSANKDQNIFTHLESNSRLIESVLIEDLYQFVSRTLDECQNLNVVDKLLTITISKIDELNSYYKRQYKLDKTKGSYQKAFERLATEFGKDLFIGSLLRNKEAHVKYKFSEIIRLIQIHISIDILEKIKIALSTNKELKSFRTKKSLPNIPKIKAIITHIKYVLDGEGEDYSLKRRRLEVNAYLDTFNSCFQMVYSTSKDQDLQSAITKYEANPVQKSLKGFLGGPSLWDFFENEEKLDGLYNTILPESVKAIQNLQLLKTDSFYDIVTKLLDEGGFNSTITRYFNGTPAQIKSSLPALLKLDSSKHSFVDNPYSPLIVVSSNSTAYNSLFKSYELEGAKSNCCDLPSLENTVVLYQEYGFMGNMSPAFSPISHLDYSNQLKDMASRAWEDPIVASRKAPYLKMETLKSYMQ